MPHYRNTMQHHSWGIVTDFLNASAGYFLFAPAVKTFLTFINPTVISVGVPVLCVILGRILDWSYRAWRRRQIEKETKKLLAIPFLVLAALAGSNTGTQAQVSNIGVLANTQLEGKGSGNGTIAGIEAQIVDRFHISGNEFALIASAQVTRDLKGYLNEYGTAVRVHARGRWYPKQTPNMFVQAGLNAGGVYYPTTATAAGYSKVVLQPGIGGGLDFPLSISHVTVGYIYLFKAPIYANHSQLDGHTTGQAVELEYSLPVKPSSKWLFLFNASYQATIYQRSVELYGPVLAAEKHRFSSVGLSVGVGRAFGK